MEIDGAAVKTEFRGEFLRSDLGPGFWQQGENLPKIPFAVRNFVLADKRWGNLAAKDQIATGNLEPQAFRATQQFPGEMVVEADLVTDVLDFTVIGDEVALETGMQCVALRALAINENPVFVSSNPHEGLDLAFDGAKTGGDRQRISRFGHVIAHLAVQVADAVRSSKAEDSAVRQLAPAPFQRREIGHDFLDSGVTPAPVF